MQKVKLNFKSQTDDNFFAETRQLVNQYFNKNHLSPKAGSSMVFKSIILISFTLGTYLLIISGLCNIWQMWLLCFLLGLGVSGISFCVLHDALHNAYSDNSFVNRWLGSGMDLLGSSSYLWNLKHNLVHHTYTNIQDFDEDIAVEIIRFSPYTKYYSFHRYQHYYGFFLYGLVYLNIVFLHNFFHFAKKNFGPFRDIQHSSYELVKLILWKAFFVFYTIVLPLYLLNISVGQFLIGYFTVMITVGFCLGLVFNLAHVVEETAYPLPDEFNQIENSWAIHQLETTNNFAPNNRVLTWFLGGLNYQVEHHLFPQICSTHYPAISKIIKATAEKYDLPYHSHPTFVEAMVSHYKMLKKLSKKPILVEDTVSVSV